MQRKVSYIPNSLRYQRHFGIRLWQWLHSGKHELLNKQLLLRTFVYSARNRDDRWQLVFLVVSLPWRLCLARVIELGWICSVCRTSRLVQRLLIVTSVFRAIVLAWCIVLSPSCFDASENPSGVEQRHRAVSLADKIDVKSINTDSLLTPWIHVVDEDDRSWSFLL